MILFNYWHLILVLFICICIFSIAKYANGQKNYLKILAKNSILLFWVIIFSVNILPNHVINFKIYNNISNVSVNENTNNDNSKNNVVKIISVAKKFFSFINN